MQGKLQAVLDTTQWADKVDIHIYVKLCCLASEKHHDGPKWSQKQSCSL